VIIVKVRNMALGIGAILLLLLAIALPASAAGGENAPGYSKTAKNSADCPNCVDCEKYHYRYQNSTSADGAHESGERLRQGAAGEEGSASKGSQGDCDRGQARKRSRDGTCGTCPRAA
jgi:hypothetical protein